MGDGPQEKPHVLVIDDDEASQQVLERVLRNASIACTMAPDGETAFMRCREKRPDLILLDLFLPGEDGFEILRRFKADPVLKTVPVIIFTILIRPESRRKAMEIGAADYITKPFDMRDILLRIRKFLPPDAPGPPRIEHEPR